MRQLVSIVFLMFLFSLFTRAEEQAIGDTSREAASAGTEKTELLPAEQMALADQLREQAEGAGKSAPKDEEHDPMIKLSEAVITVPIQEGVSLEDAIASMRLRANQLNVKFVGHMPLWQEYQALGLEDIQRTEIFQFCDARIAKRMLDYDINFLAYMPCRIGIIEDKQGKGWLVSMNLNIFISSETLPEDLKQLAMGVRDDIEEIMEAGASGAL